MTSRKFSGLVLCICVSFVDLVSAQTLDRSLDTGRLLGIELTQANAEKVREHLWKLGGFVQTQATYRLPNIDRFSSWSQLTDSYYVEFRYNPDGELLQVKRLYRPYSVDSTQSHQQDTQRVAQSLIEEYGPPTAMMTKSVGSGFGYSSYLWRSDQLDIVVDRQGGDGLGNVFVEYRLRERATYGLAQTQP